MLPWETDHTFRYIIRSKDRVSGVPNNFVAQLSNPIPDNADEVWVKLQDVTLDCFPHPTDLVTIEKTSSTITGLYNLPDSEAATFGLDTGSCVDLCIGCSTLNTLDTFKQNYPAYTIATPIAVLASGRTTATITIDLNDKTGIYLSSADLFAVSVLPGGTNPFTYTDPVTGTTNCLLQPYAITATGVTFAYVTPSGAPVPVGSLRASAAVPLGANIVAVSRSQPAKTQADVTLELVAYARDKYEKTLRLSGETSWVRINTTNLSQVALKLFSDTGFPLKLRKVYAASVADAVDININEWSCVLLVAVKTKLPKGQSQHKI